MKYLWAVLSLVAVFACGSAKAAAPANDDWENAIILKGQNALATGSNVDATGQPAIGSDNNHSVWYSWTPAISGATTIITSGNTFDTTLSLYTGETIDTLLLVDFDDDSGPGLESKITLDAVAGVTYSIAVDSFADVTGFFGFAIQQVSVALSDDFATATPVVGTSFVVTGDNVSATAEAHEPPHAGKVAAKSVWLQWTAPGHGSVKLSTADSYFDTLLSVYTGTALTDLHPVAQNDNVNFLSKTSAAGFIADTGVTYYIAIDGAFEQSGFIKFALDFTPTAPGIAKLQNEIVRYGNTASFTAVASGTGILSYQWQRAAAGSKTWVSLSDGTVSNLSATDNGVTYGGTATATLTVDTVFDPALPTNNDQFRCIVTDSIGTSTSSTGKLILTVLDTVDATVRGIVPTIDLTTGGHTGDTYFAKGLPAGLVLNPVNGLVTGAPTAKPGAYVVTYWTQTGTVKSTPLTLLIQVNPLIANLSGGFEAILEDPVLNTPVGKIQLLVNSTTGAFTGTLTCSDAKAYALRGTLNLNATYDIATASLIISRGKSVAPYGLALTLDASGPAPVFSPTFNQLDSSNAFVSVLGQSTTGVQLTTYTASSPAPWQGLYTLILDDPTTPPLNMGVPVAPEGTGFGTVTIKADKGLFVVAGKLGDGTTLTSSLAPSSDGSYRWYVKPYKKTGGYFGGWIQLVPVSGIVPPYQMVGTANSELYWQKSVSSSKDKSYRAGFGPISITATAQVWTIPTGAQRLSNLLQVTVSNGLFKSGFTSASLPVVDAPLVPTDLTLGGTNLITVTLPLANSDRFSTKINTTTGAFTGSMTLQDQRKISISGVMLQQPASINTGDVIGEGFFLIPSQVKGGETVSGKIQFTAP